jgi:hypothetical protein
MLATDNSNATDYTNQYNNYSGQANAANQAVGDYAKGMQGAYDANTGNGNAGSAYNFGLNQQLGKTGYTQGAMDTATNNLNQSNGALSAYSDFANQGASKWGMNAGGFAAANAGALGSINNNIASNQGQVSQLMDKYKTAQTGANQFAGQTVQGQHETMIGLQNVYANASSQRDSAASSMKMWAELAATQGGLNAKQASDYAAAQDQYTHAQTNIALASQAYASAKAQLAQAGYLGSQTTGQNIINQASQQQLDASRKAVQSTPTTSQPMWNGLQASSGANLQGGNGMQLQGSGANLQGGSVRLQ